VVAVVIDESHNVTNSETLNNQLARVLAPNTEVDDADIEI
jgi:hypothetical protein